MRFRGSSWKRSRYLSYSILETQEELKKRNYAPGQHGKSRRKKTSEYGKQLREKQKLRFTYGVNERQFRRLFELAVKEKEVTGLAFFQILESRLDNLVFRMGFTRTRAHARQLVNHGHITVNGNKIDIPSYLCQVNDVIALNEKSLKLTLAKVVRENLASLAGVKPYVSVDKEKLTGKFERKPERNELSLDINESQIVEYYNRLL